MGVGGWVLGGWIFPKVHCKNIKRTVNSNILVSFRHGMLASISVSLSFSTYYSPGILLDIISFLL